MFSYFGSRLDDGLFDQFARIILNAPPNGGTIKCGGSYPLTSRRGRFKRSQRR